MNSNYRGIDHIHSKILKDNVETTILQKEVFDKFDVAEIVRIPIEDYPENVKSGDVFSHFNLTIPEVEIGRKVVLSKLLRHGFFSEEKEVLLLLSLENVWTAEIVDFKQFADYEKLPEEIFNNSIGKIQDVDGLKRIILERYFNILVGKSKEEVLDIGFTVRFFKLNKIVSY